MSEMKIDLDRSESLLMYQRLHYTIQGLESTIKISSDLRLPCSDVNFPPIQKILDLLATVTWYEIISSFLGRLYVQEARRD